MLNMPFSHGHKKSSYQSTQSDRELWQVLSVKIQGILYKNNAKEEVNKEMEQ